VLPARTFKELIRRLMTICGCRIFLLPKDYLHRWIVRLRNSYTDDQAADSD